MDHADPQTAALEHLAAALDPRDHATTLVTGQDRVPYLTVSSRHATLAEDIYADERSYWWSWAEPIAAIGNPQAAATKISHVLHATPEPTHG